MLPVSYDTRYPRFRYGLMASLPGPLPAIGILSHGRSFGGGRSVRAAQGRMGDAASFIQPRLITARFDWRVGLSGASFNAEIWGVNDDPDRLTRWMIQAALDGVCLLHLNDLTIQPGSSQRMGALAVTLSRSPTTLTLALPRGAAAIASNCCDLRVHLPLCYPSTTRLMRRGADLLLRIRVSSQMIMLPSEVIGPEDNVTGPVPFVKVTFRVVVVGAVGMWATRSAAESCPHIHSPRLGGQLEGWLVVGR
jgi:hypothetical protein